jgi:hypothetical protein
MKAVVAVAGSAWVLLAHALLIVFAGTAPSDIATGAWGIISGIGIFIINYIVGKFGPTRPVSVPAEALPGVNAAVKRAVE